MAYVAQLCNPTPWPVEFNYEKGVQLVVPPFGSLDLTMNQMDDFRPDKPGAENVQENLEFHGVFLRDNARPYDNQALETLRKCYRTRSQRYYEITEGHKERAARQGIQLDESTYQRVLKQMGMIAFKEKVDTLEELIAEYEEVVTEESSERRRPQLDPARTVFALPKPREFPSVVARDFFLKHNPEIAEKEAKLREEWEKAEAREAS